MSVDLLFHYPQMWMSFRVVFVVNDSHPGVSKDENYTVDIGANIRKWWTSTTPTTDHEAFQKMFPKVGSQEIWRILLQIKC